jgi:signal transduction histidine kinase
MMTSLQFQPPSSVNDSLTLHKLTDRLITSLLPRATLSKSVIVNDINTELHANADQELLASVLSCLLHNAIVYSPASSIRVSAKAFGYITLLHVRTNDTQQSELFCGSLNQLQPLAEKLGGCITVTNNSIQGATLAFTFINPAAVLDEEKC